MTHYPNEPDERRGLGIIFLVIGLATLAGCLIVNCRKAHGADFRAMPKPQDAATSPEATALGRMLAFDERLSSTRTHSCMTCHLPDKGYSDGLTVSQGATDKTTRNAPTLLNSGYKTVHFLDGRADFLEGQANEPIQSDVEMGQTDPNLPFKRIAQIPAYQQKFQEVFGRGVNRQDGLKAIAAFQRTLVSTDAPIDRAVSWEYRTDGRWYYKLLPAAKWVFDDAQYRGMQLFFHKGRCTDCHQSPDYRLDGQFHNIGLAYVSRLADGTRDQGRELIDDRESSRRAFAVPTLREIQATAPYGHAGQLPTLRDVVAFKSNPPADPYRSPFAAPIGLSAGEQADLVAFLEAAFAGKYPKVDAPSLPVDPEGYVHLQENQGNGRVIGRLFRRRR